MVLIGTAARIGRLLAACSAFLLLVGAAPVQPTPLDASMADGPAGTPDIIVIGNLSAVETDHPGEVAQSTADQRRIRTYLDRTGLRYGFLFLPWGRAYRTVQERENALIFNMLRTPLREDMFHWLISMERGEAIHLVARRGSPQETMTPEEIAKSTCKAACTAASAQCRALRDFGFADERIIEVAEAQHGMAEQLLLRGRVDFIAELPSDLSATDPEGQDITDKLVVRMPLSAPNSPWLAAPKSIDPRLLEELQSVLTEEERQAASQVQ